MLLAGSPGSLDSSFGSGGMVTTLIDAGNTAAVGALQPMERLSSPEESAWRQGSSRWRCAVTCRTASSIPASARAITVRTCSIRLSRWTVHRRSRSSSDPGQADDGDFVVTGSWYDPTTSVYGSALARFTPAGSPDPSFGGNGAILEPSSNIVTITGPVLIQPGGKIVVAGVRIQNGSQVAVVERFNVNGTLDSTFASQASDGTLFSGPSSLVRGLAFDANGNIRAIFLWPAVKKWPASLVRRI